MTEQPRYNVNLHNDEKIAEAVDRPIPKELISERSSGGNNTVAYLKGDIDVDRLNEIFGPLGWGVVAGSPQIDRFEDKRTKWEKAQGGGRATPKEVDMVIYAVTTQVTLTIKARSSESTDTVFTQTGVGYGEVEPGKHAKDAIGMAVKGAETDGLKRCCTLLGQAFGMFLNSDGSQSDVEYAHRGNKPGLQKAKRIRNDSQGSPSRRNESSVSDRNEDRNERPASRQSREDERREDESRKSTPASKQEEDKPKRSRPKANVNEDFDLESEPVTRSDQIAYGATIVKKLKDAKNKKDREDLIRRHRDTISNLEGNVLVRLKEAAKQHDIDIDKITG